MLNANRNHKCEDLSIKIQERNERRYPEVPTYAVVMQSSLVIESGLFLGGVDALDLRIGMTSYSEPII
jgi:hypothetical protein